MDNVTLLARFGRFQRDNWWNLSRFRFGFGRFKETIDGFMSHVENSSSWGGWGGGDGGDGGGWWANPDLSERHSGIGRVWSAVLVFRLSSSVFSLNRD